MGKALLSEDLLKKVRRIEITTHRSVDDLMGGRYKSQFRGQGVQFSEHREYVAGDDVRHIDWKVSARSRDPMIKKFEEERELTVMLLIDISGSQEFGSGERSKRDVTAELAALLAFTAARTGDKIGCILFAGEIEARIAPGKGRAHVLRMVHQILATPAPHPGSNLTLALETASRVMRQSGIVFILSDFICEGYEHALKRLARRQDCIALQIEDPVERVGLGAGVLEILDPETGETRVLDTQSYAFQQWIKADSQREDAALKQKFQANQIDWLRVSTGEDYAEALVRFFQKRSRRRR